MLIKPLPLRISEKVKHCSDELCHGIDLGGKKVGRETRRRRRRSWRRKNRKGREGEKGRKEGRKIELCYI